MTSDTTEPLVKRTLRSIGWRMSANLVAMVILLIRAIVLARLLEIETFGTYAFAFAIVKLSSVLASFGFGSALLHRHHLMENEGEASSQHFTLTLVFSTAWAMALIAASAMVRDPDLRTALLALTATSFGLQLAQTPRVVLVRRVDHRRLALVDLGGAVLSSVTAVVLALQGAELWALLATDVIVTAVTLVLLYFWRPVCRLRLIWSRQSVEYFLRFGCRSVLANLLVASFGRIESLWTGLVFGGEQLGFYSRAATFAGLPRRAVANAVNIVTRGTFAELKGDRERLTVAFRRVNGLFLWVGLFLAGLLGVTAEEVIVVVIGQRWLPIVQPLRLLLFYSTLVPIERSVADLLAGVGEPERSAYGRGLRLVVLLLGLSWLGTRFGIVGVACSAGIAIVAELGLLLAWSRRHVDFSVLSIAGPPLAACMLGVGAALALAPAESTELARGLIKGLVFAVVFAGPMGYVRRREIRELLSGFDRSGPGLTDDRDSP